jgi:hypothetical protein
MPLYVVLLLLLREEVHLLRVTVKCHSLSLSPPSVPYCYLSLLILCHPLQRLPMPDTPLSQCLFEDILIPKERPALLLKISPLLLSVHFPERSPTPTPPSELISATLAYCCASGKTV